MSPKAPARKPRSKAKQAGPNLFERIAKTAYEATRAWCGPIPGTPRPPWEKAEPWRRQSAIEGVKQAVLAGRTPEQLHEEWRKDRVKRGWSDGGEKNNPLLQGTAGGRWDHKRQDWTESEQRAN